MSSPLTLTLSPQGVVQMTSDGQPCSLQEVRARVLSTHPDREPQYRLYAHLSRLGYRPVRHSGAPQQCRYTGERAGSSPGGGGVRAGLGYGVSG